MNLTFPTIGHSGILFSALFRSLGVPFTAPVTPSEQDLELALRLSPEGACMPFKTVMSSFLSSYRRSADTGIFFGGCGPCSFGWFSTAMNEIFKTNGIDFHVYTLEFGCNELKELFSYVRDATGKSNVRLVSRALPMLLSLMYLDFFEKRILDIRATLGSEKARSEFSRFERAAFKRLESAKGFFSLLFCIYKELAQAVLFKEKRPYTLNIGITGDIFSIIDSGSNFNMQKYLADMGVRTRRSMTLTKWVLDHVPFLFRPWKSAASRYMSRGIGGFAHETVGYTALWAKRMDGIIQVYPLNCMPETAAAAVLPKIREERGIAVLQIAVDEGAGSEGFYTRLEAFADMLIRQKTFEGGVDFA